MKSDQLRSDRHSGRFTGVGAVKAQAAAHKLIRLAHSHRTEYDGMHDAVHRGVGPDAGRLSE
jgi:hypothetical protein